ncbi:MAG: hypothetical protein JJE36_01395 [Coriobacteriia bacterium]|nr:hypothetical protein [Coriobacteriia bacterium]
MMEDSRKVVPILTIVVLVLLVAIVLLVKNLTIPTVAVQSSSSSKIDRAASSNSFATGSLTSVRNDAVSDYTAALKTGKPVYVLFHSLTCDPCVEISAVAEKVMPDYQKRVVFVNAITDDASGQALATKFAFQYIPTSFFIGSGGQATDSYTGVLTESQMRSRLDTLVKSK